MAVVIVRPLIAASISLSLSLSLSLSFFFFLNPFFLFFFFRFRFGCLDDSGGEFAMMDLCVREHS